MGCLLAGAAGDALGAAVEFDTWDDIQRRCGPAGVTGYLPAYGVAAPITDDTQLTLFTAEGLIRGMQRSREQGICDAVGVLRRSYLRWLHTQGEAPGDDEEGFGADAATSGWLVHVPELLHQRAPGSTCLAALRSGRRGDPHRPLNGSKGCGGVMRVAPCGVLGEQAFEYGVDAAALTHGHPTGQLAAGAFAEMVRRLLEGADLPHAVTLAVARTALEPEGAETVAALRDAVAAALASTGRRPGALELGRLGAGWVAEEALAIGVLAALTAPDLRTGLLTAVNHSGDSDSTGSICGNLLGAAWGAEEIPDDLLDPLEARGIVEQVANDLADAFIDERPLDRDRYPGW